MLEIFVTSFAFGIVAGPLAALVTTHYELRKLKKDKSNKPKSYNIRMKARYEES